MIYKPSRKIIPILSCDYNKSGYKIRESRFEKVF